MRRVTRRAFVRSGAVTALLGAVPGRMFATRAPEPVEVSHDPERLDMLVYTADPSMMKALAQCAADAARAAGAGYADVRVTRTVRQRIEHPDDSVVSARIRDMETLAIGVRALVNGYWGFASSPYWDPEEAEQLARSAVSQAKTNALGTPRIVEWEPIGAAATGAWVTPGVDPFSIPIEEKADFVNAWRIALLDIPRTRVTVRPSATRLMLARQERCLVSTEGTATMQTLYETEGSFPVTVALNDWRAARDGRSIRQRASGLYIQRGGWDVILDARIREQIPLLIERGERRIMTQVKPVDIGRYDVVFDASTMAGILTSTFGIATQLDRARGFEANAGGTSYLGPEPLEFLGTAPVAAPIVTVTANRSMSRGAATVQWDDEGIAPEAFPLVEKGVLKDYQTTREQAAWLKPWYQQQQRPARSHGCAWSNSALDTPLQQPPNLVLEPGTTPASFDALVAGISRGLAVMEGGVSTDQQARHGTGSGLVREIVDGKLGRICEGAGFLFTSQEFWRSVTALGDVTTVRTTGQTLFKGQPAQSGAFGVATVPAAVKNVSIIDIRRRA